MEVYELLAQALGFILKACLPLLAQTRGFRLGVCLTLVVQA
jgi:hypothetical protein